MARVVTFGMKVRPYGSRSCWFMRSCPVPVWEQSPPSRPIPSARGIRLRCDGGMTRPHRRRRPSVLLSAAALLILVTALPAQAASTVVCESPVTPVSVSRLASLPANDWLPGHRGIDLSTAIGHTVTSPAAGVVTYVGFVVDRPVVSVRHRGGLVSSLEPVDATIQVGQTVEAGDPLGTVADAPGHCSPTACVHWGLRFAGEYVNPLDYLHGFGPVRLLPLNS